MLIAIRIAFADRLHDDTTRRNSCLVAVARRLLQVATEEINQALAKFVAERDWDQFHTIPNLIKSISIEAAELLECVQWDDELDDAKLREELADVLTYCTLLAAKLGLDPDELMLEKLETTAAKYPVEKSRGSSAKYDQLLD